MFKKNRILFLLAAASLVTACGGGNAPATGTDTQQSSTSGSNNTGTTSNGNGTATSNDQQLAGYLSLVASQMPYIKGDRSIYNAVSLAQLEADQGMYDFASGSKGGDENTWVPPSAIAPAAPIAAFGFRVDKFVQRATAGQSVANQTVVGRVAFSLTERADSPGIQANESAEVMKFVIDGVELKSDAQGQLVSASVKQGAQMHIYGRDAAAREIRTSIPVPTGAVRLMSVSNVLDNYGDTTSVVLLFDLEAAFSQAGDKLASLENMAGHFNMNVTLSTAQLVRPAAPANDWEPAVERRDLVGQSITVNDQPVVTGGGVSGSAWVRMLPPA